ncbi:hypothetical protein ACIBF6_40675 [Streptosporangium amethystogenes]|uniref:caspase, EACC1-associated type n=1 Tax=Streptosporangium TaxID=2000 RepID=UPI00342FA3B4
MLIGVGTYTHLPPVKAALNSLARFTSVLTGPLCGWPADRISVISDVRQPGDLPDRLVELFEPVQDIALFYYVGHGQVDPDDKLCLGLVDSRAEASRRKTTSLPFGAVRDALRSGRPRTKIVILDCCYAGLAAGRHGSLAASDNILDRTLGAGDYTLAAAEQFATAWYDTDTTTTPQTYFTQYLADVIEAGIPGKGPDLTLDSIYHATHDALGRNGKPLPTSRANGQATRIVFARNAAAIPPEAPPSLPSQDPSPATQAPSSPEVAAAHTESEKDEPAATDSHHPTDTKESHLNGKADGVILLFSGLVIVLAFIVLALSSGSTAELTLSSVTGGARPRAVKTEGQINAFDYRLSSGAPITSDFTVPAMDDPRIVFNDSERGKRYLRAEIAFTPDKPCMADATLTWTWTGVAHSDHAQRKMKLNQKAVLALVELSGKTLRFSATISSSIPCAGSLKLINARIRNSSFRPQDERSPDFSPVKIETQKT